MAVLSARIYGILVLKLAHAFSALMKHANKCAQASVLLETWAESVSCKVPVSWHEASRSVCRAEAVLKSPSWKYWPFGQAVSAGLSLAEAYPMWKALKGAMPAATAR